MPLLAGFLPVRRGRSVTSDAAIHLDLVHQALPGATVHAVGVFVGRDYVPQNRGFSRHTLAKKRYEGTNQIGPAIPSGLRNFLPFALRRQEGHYASVNKSLARLIK